MIYPPYPQNERERQQALDAYAVLDSLPEKDFDDITALCAYICDTKVSLIALMDKDRNWFKSAYGVPFMESPRDISFCGHAITSEAEHTIIEDARNDERFHDNPLVSELKEAIFYLGVPLVNNDGFKLGTLCVFDNKPRQLTHKQVESVKALARQVMHLFEMKKRNDFLQLLSNQLKEKNSSLENFAGIVSHDMKMPLANIITTTDVIKQKYGQLLGHDGDTYMKYLKQSAFSLSDYITGMLNYYTSADLLNDDTKVFLLNDVLEEVIDFLNIKVDCEIILPERNIEMQSNSAVIKQIFVNLLTNALKYNDKESISIVIVASEDENGYSFGVSDNGIGISQEQLKTVFNLFKTATHRDRNGNKGSGIGLSTVKKLIKSSGGQINVTSEIGVGTNFNFTIEKPELSQGMLKIA